MSPVTEAGIFFHRLALAIALGVFIGLLSVSIASGEGTIVVTLGDDMTVQEDQSITFMSSVSYTGTLMPTYTWSFGDGSTSNAQAPTHVYTKAGTYTVSLSVADPDGVQDSDSLEVTVLNVRPIADAGGGRSVFEGTTVTFDGSGSWDTSSDLPLLTYEWDFGDGTGTGGASKDNKVVTHTYAEAGIYIVRLVVRDDDWMEDNSAYFESQLIQVEDSSSGGGTLSFYYDVGSGSGSTSPSPTPSDHEFYWDFGDGSYSTGNSATHTYAEDGLYIVTLIYTDAFGAMSVHHILVTVLNSPPTAEAGPDRSADEDQYVAFFGEGSDPGGGEVTYSWDFGDGHAAPDQNAIHAYTKEGTYTATLTVTDSHGLTATDTCKVSVSNVAPTAGITTSQNNVEGDAVSFSGSTSTDTQSDIPLLMYSWSFGDGTTGSGLSASHAYDDDGTYTVTLTVTDDDGAQATATTTITLGNAAPLATIVSATGDTDPVLPNINVTFQGSCTDAGAGDTHTYSWSFGDGDSGTGNPIIHAYDDPGTYTVTLTVTDDDGGSSTASTTVVVESASAAAEDAQDVVADAPTSSFDKAQDQKLISDKFDVLLEDLASGKTNQVLSSIHVLEVQVSNKVTDSNLQAQLLAILQAIEDSVSGDGGG